MSDPLLDDLPTEFLADFVGEALDLLTRCETGLLSLEHIEDVARLNERFEDVLRDLHTLKGNAAMMGLGAMEVQVHSLETDVGALANNDSNDGSITTILAEVDSLRVQTRRLLKPDLLAPQTGQSDVGRLKMEGVRLSFSILDGLVEQAVELLVDRNRLANLVEAGRRTNPDNESWRQVDEAHRSLDLALERIRTNIFELRMTPLRGLFNRLRRIAYEQGRRCEKQVRFDDIGGDTPIDRALQEKASEVLGHLVRNAVVHGLEQSHDRLSAGKNSSGHITVEARIKGESVFVEVKDDGRGIDLESIRAKALARGVMPSAIDPLELIFQSGLSTREEVDSSAGRGIGLSVVREGVRSVGGEVSVHSTPGEGTSFLLRLPLRVSVAEVLTIEVDKQRFALPSWAMMAGYPLHPGDELKIGDARVIVWRERFVPLVDLGVLLGTSQTSRGVGFVLVIEVEDRLCGILADRMGAMHEIVVRNLDPILGSPPMINNCTVLGDGEAILLLDPQALVAAAPIVEIAA